MFVADLTEDVVEIYQPEDFEGVERDADAETNNNYFYTHAYTMHYSEPAPDDSAAVKLAPDSNGSTDAPDGPT